VVPCISGTPNTTNRARRARRLRDVVLVRLEQISPFPHDLLINAVRQYKHAELVWCQEEPKNMGAWGYVQPRLRAALRHCNDDAAPGASSSSSGSGSSSDDEAAAGAGAAGVVVHDVRYVGRAAAASPATASFGIHQKETQEIIDAALLG
jgi:2-oxoglutarate dehydrogenase E1 component